MINRVCIKVSVLLIFCCAQSFAQQGEKEAAMEAYQSAAKTRDLNLKIERLKKAIAHDSTFSKAYRELGAAYFDKSQYDSARKYLTRNFELGSDSFDIYNYLALTSEALFEFKEAENWLSILRDVDPNFQGLKDIMQRIHDKRYGEECINRGDWDSAKKIFERLLVSLPIDPQVYFFWGIIHVQEGKYKYAEQDFGNAEANGLPPVYLNRLKEIINNEKEAEAQSNIQEQLSVSESKDEILLEKETEKPKIDIKENRERTEKATQESKREYIRGDEKDDNDIIYSTRRTPKTDTLIQEDYEDKESANGQMPLTINQQKNTWWIIVLALAFLFMIILISSFNRRRKKIHRSTSSEKYSSSDLGERMTPKPMVKVLKGRYELIKELGRGGMGVVYKAFDRNMQRFVALKLIQYDANLSPSELEEMKTRLRREATTAGTLSPDNIVIIYDVDEDESLGMLFISMEYLEGQNLQQLLKEENKLDMYVAAQIVLQICRALIETHGKGIVHRDIKPSNIWIRKNGKIKLLDFGIAKISVSTLTSTGFNPGTPQYMSPEQIDNKILDGRSDIFSLGIVFYEMLTGHQPFKGDSISSTYSNILHRDPPLPSNTKNGIISPFDQIIIKMLEKDREKRYQTTFELLSDLQRIKKDILPSDDTILLKSKKVD